jgi:DNA helicase-2/ATP-dependent DNA helicase PcrA
MADADRILEGLNPEQLRAATATGGPVAILAGAGTGKTTTITRRVAYQVATEAFPAQAILAVTFTEKAASELRSRLARLGVTGVEARTFHAAALSQLGRMWSRHTGRELPEILPAKAPLIASLANALPPPHKFLPRSELAGEIEWAKNRTVEPDRYLDALERAAHDPPIPPELMLRVFDGYERRKERARRIDFEDVLRLAGRLFEERPDAAEEIRRRFHAFTVDEYQDVNLLQQTLLDAWLGGRNEVCVVGDDYQSIYTFTGATPEYLLAFERRHPEATVVRLERNYRSSPQVLTVANALAASMGGVRKELRATRPDGPSPTARWFPDTEAEVAFVVAATRELSAAGTPLEEIAILSRINARSEPFEEAFADARIPYQVRDGAFLRRPGPRSVLGALRRADGPAISAVERVTDELGFAPDAEPDADEEATRQADLGRMRSLAAEFEQAQSGADVAAFVGELGRRFSTEESGRGVNLLTYHRSKGLEFDAVFLPRLLDGELPYRSKRGRADTDEERRLLYVGLTRARRDLYLSWVRDGRTRPSPFLREIGVADGASAPSRTRRAVEPAGGGLFGELRTWRARRAKEDGVPAYVIFHDATLRAIAERRPHDWAALAGVSGVGPAKLERYADEVLEIVNAGG